MKILYLSTAQTEKEFIYTKNQEKHYNEIYGMPEASTKFHNLMIDGLCENECDVFSLICRPVSNKAHKKIFWKAKIEKNERALYFHLPTINIPILKNLISIIGVAFMLLYWNLKNFKHKNRQIIYDGAYISLIPTTNLISSIFGVKKTAIVCDVYSYMSSEGVKNNNNSTFVLFIKKIFGRALKKADNYVFLTEDMNKIINDDNKPYIVIEGIANLKENIKKDFLKQKSKFVIMYAGALRKEYGIDILLEGFHMYDNTNAELWIYGKGPYENVIMDFAAKDKRIIFGGTLENKIIMELEQKATLLVNPRPTNQTFVKYSFPSKNMEYMSSGTPILTTKLAGMPQEYYDYIYTIDSETSFGVKEKLEKIGQMDQEELFIKGRKAKDFILKNKNPKIQAQKVIDSFGLIKNKSDKRYFAFFEKILLMILIYLSIFPGSSSRYIFLFTIFLLSLMAIKSNYKVLKLFIKTNLIIILLIMGWLSTYFIYWIIGKANLFPMYFFTYFRIGITIIIGLYYLFTNKANIYKSVFNFSMFMICIINIYTIYRNILQYNLSRVLATGNEIGGNVFGVASYPYVYGLAFFIIPLIFIFKKTKDTKTKIISAFTIITSFFTIIETEFLIGIILLIMGIIMYILKINNLKKIIIIVLISIISILIVSRPLSILCTNLSNKINSNNLSIRLKDISYFLDGNLDKTVDLKLRLAVYNKSINTFVKHPFFGVGFNGTKKEIYFVGKHSTFLDELAQYGFLGAIPLFAMLIAVMRKVKNNLQNNNAKDCYFISSILFILFILINNGLFIANICFLFIITPFSLKILEEKN